MAAPEPSSSERIDRLNPVERELLILLGRGHTAKTIANLKGLSVAAVNERFRAARRKTGLGSSREIARLLTAQENRHDFIELAGVAASPSESSRLKPAPRRRVPLPGRWSLLMITAILAAALLAQQTATPPAVRSEGLAADIMSRQTVAPDLADLHARVSRGDRDEDWSPRTESALAQRYEAVPNFARDVPTISFRCSADLCEAAGVMRADISGDDVTEMMIRLQGIGNPTPLPGLDHVVHSFSTAGDRPPAFIAYWRRR